MPEMGSYANMKFKVDSNRNAMLTLSKMLYINKVFAIHHILFQVRR